MYVNWLGPIYDWSFYWKILNLTHLSHTWKCISMYMLVCDGDKSCTFIINLWCFWFWCENSIVLCKQWGGISVWESVNWFNLCIFKRNRVIWCLHTMLYSTASVANWFVWFLTFKSIIVVGVLHCLVGVIDLYSGYSVKH